MKKLWKRVLKAKSFNFKPEAFNIDRIFNHRMKQSRKKFSCYIIIRYWVTGELFSNKLRSQFYYKFADSLILNEDAINFTKENKQRKIFITLPLFFGKIILQL